NGNINTSYYVRLTNPLANYTVTDLRLKFLVPLNVTTTNLTSYDNTTYVITAWGNMNVTWKMNNTDWEAGKDVFISQSNFSFVDSQTGSPTNNYNITVVFRSFEINLSYSNFSNWDPTSQNAAGIGLTSISNITANMTANMFFPLINKTFSNSSVCSAGGKYFYNVTVTMANRGRLNLTSELGSCFNTDRENIVIKLDGVILNETANRTIGSLEVNDVESGAHTVAVSYSVKAAGAGSSGGGTTSSGGDGGGGAADTSTKETPLTKTGLFDLVPGVDSIFLIEDPEGVNRIVISARSFIIAASFTFTKLTELPKSITTPTGKVHSMFSLTKDNIKDTDISSLKIEFLVLKNYLKDNNLQKEQIKLMRYTTQWNTLPTTILSEDNKAIKYQATTPGTSYFAIATEEVSAQAPTTGEVVEEEPLVTKAPPTSAVWIIIIVLLILALVIFYIYKRKTTNKKA
ncbi:PGF-pre-PGF domain-containing protein, partial [Candidatus Woesearchaeota archaeon]|nr:PGF-pre-PGF domain-containing protein [Candidatus Woesearchaeota archaeon]